MSQTKSFKPFPDPLTKMTIASDSGYRAAYERFIEAYIATLDVQDPVEDALAWLVADSIWRMQVPLFDQAEAGRDFENSAKTFLYARRRRTELTGRLSSKLYLKPEPPAAHPDNLIQFPTGDALKAAQARAARRRRK